MRDPGWTLRRSHLPLALSRLRGRRHSASAHSRAYAAMRQAHPRKHMITKRPPTEYLKSQSAFGSGDSCIGRNRLAAAYSSLIWQIARDLVRPRDLEACSFLSAPTTESRRRLSDDKTGKRGWQVSKSHFHQKIRAHPYLAYLSRICPATPHAFEDRDALSGEGAGVIWDGILVETPVIPAKAGIQFVDNAFPRLAE